MRRGCTATALLLLLAFAPAAVGGEGGPAVPLDLDLPTIDGEVFSRETLRGRKVLLVEFASW